MIPDELRARYRTHDEIRAHGAIGNLGDGVEITAHGLSTRLLAWPGTGFQTEAVHVITVEPGQESERFCYDLAEEAMLCRSGKVDVWLRDRWVELQPGDIAYVPEGVERAVRNHHREPCILVTQITPPQFDLYAEHGLYNVELGVMNYDSIHKACTNAKPVELPRENEMRFHATAPDVRSQNLERHDVRARGALFNILMGAAFTGIGLPMRLVLWPGAGCRTAGFNYAEAADGVEDVIHEHPVSDECLVMWGGRGAFFIDDQWVEAEANDVALAPCGVAHGHRSTEPSWFGGFASPPQLDLLLPTDYYVDGVFSAPEATRLRP
jgi:mannose-6-phosphate isomerase-like protein (cupin superfamily)